MFVGEGAGTADPGWYNTFQDLALQDRLLFFNGRKSNALAWTNQPGDRRDWQFNAQFISLEMFATLPALGEYLTNPLDSTVYPQIWGQLAQAMSIQIAMGDAADIVWQSNLAFIPTSSAPTGGAIVGPAAPSSIMGTIGTPIKKNNTLPLQLNIPAKSKLDVSLQIAPQLKQLFNNVLLPAPGRLTLPVGPGGAPVSSPIWYGIRLSLYGIRRVQLRGAMEA